jgi:predicted transcriptional regulator
MGSTTRTIVIDEQWQIGEIMAGIREADTGRLVGHDKVKAKWEAKLAGSLVKGAKQRR